MRFDQLVILLSCHSLEDFPVHLDGEAAESLLSNWIALWHPALIESSQSMPTWCRVDEPPENCHNKLIVVPTNADSSLPTGFVDRVQEQGGQIVRRLTERDEVIAAVLEPLDQGTSLDHKMVEDFWALGYIYLQIQLMTRHLRYSSNLDETHFSVQVTAAATAAQKSDWETTTAKLQVCFDLLSEERNRYYPVDALLVDLTLVADTTIGKSLARQLKRQHPTSFLITGDVVQKMAELQPENLSEIRSAIQAETASLVGGPESEFAFPLMSIESIIAQFEKGHRSYIQHFGRRPKIFGRRRFGLTSVIPQVLAGYGYAGAVHSTMDEGTVPAGSQSNISWEAPDGTSVDAIGCPPVDATLPETFLKLGISIGESIDVAHTASTLFAHWPDKVHPCFDDLAVSCRYGNVLGMLVTIEDYFSQVANPGYNDTFNEDQYRSPFLQTAIIQKHANPVSRQVSYWRNEMAYRSIRALNAMSIALGIDRGNSDVEELRDVIDSASEFQFAESTGPTEVSGRIAEAATDAESALLAAIGGTESAPGESTNTNGDEILLINSCSFPRRFMVQTPLRHLSSCQQDEVYCSSGDQDLTRLQVDCPAMGYTRLSPQFMTQESNPKEAKKKKAFRAAQTPIVDENVLRNEFFQLEIDRTTGGIRSLHLYDRRGNLMTQRLALRSGKRGSSRTDGHSSGNDYSEMTCDSFTVDVSDSVLGQITTRGKLVNGESHVANYVQTARVLRGRRVIELEFEIEPMEMPVANPWASYYCSRFAWYEESAELYRAVNDSRHFVAANRIEAPVYLEIVEPTHRLALLTGGIPWHLRQNRRMLDSLLMTSGESVTRFKMGIGVNLTHPLQSAIDFVTPQIEKRISPDSQARQTDWLYHLSSKNIVATDWVPLANEHGTGIRIRMKETEGRAGLLKITSGRTIQKGFLTRLDGTETSALDLTEGIVKLNFRGNELFQVELYW